MTPRASKKASKATWVFKTLHTIKERGYSCIMLALEGTNQFWGGGDKSGWPIWCLYCPPIIIPVTYSHPPANFVGSTLKHREKINSSISLTKKSVFHNLSICYCTASINLHQEVYFFTTNLIISIALFVLYYNLYSLHAPFFGSNMFYLMQCQATK